MKKILILLFAILGLIILVVFLNSKNKNQDIVTTNYNLEAPEISDKNLAQFYLWTQEDPLFTAPNFDTVTFSDAISNLKAAEALYLKQFKLTNKIYPDNFLNDLISVNKAHNDFMNNKTAANAKKLITVYKTTAMDYESGIDNLKLSMQQLTPVNIKTDSNTIYFQGINTVTTLKTFYDDLEKIRLNANMLKQEISKRQACLEYGSGCQRPVNDYSNFEISDKSYNFNKNDILSKELLYYEPSFASTIWQGPYIVSTQCMGWSDDFNAKPYLFYLLKRNSVISITDVPKKYTLDIAKIATDRYYRLLDPHEKKTYGDQYKRIPQIETNDYMCPSYEYSIKLKSINFLYTNYKNKQIFTNLLKLESLSDEAGQFLASGQKLEQKFFDAEFPSETDADNLVNYYGLLYKKILIWTQKSDYTRKSWLVSLFNQKTEILNIYLGYKRGLVDIDRQIINSAYGLSVLREYTALLSNQPNASIRPQFYTYMIRSYLGLFYFPFSKSFYRYDRPLDYIVKTKVNNVGFDKQYITYWEALKHYSINEIKSWYILQDKIYTALKRHAD